MFIPCSRQKTRPHPTAIFCACNPTAEFSQIFSVNIPDVEHS